MSTFQYSTSIVTFATIRQHFYAVEAYFKKFGKDSTAKVAQHCARTTTKLLQQSPLYRSQHAFSAPRVKLATFIDRLLRETGIPLSTALTTLKVIGWLTKAGMCPLASSSPHHLFMAVLRLVAHSSSPPSLSRSCDGDKQWVAYAGGVFSSDEVLLMRMEVQATLRMLDDPQWALITNAGSEDRTLVSQSSKDIADFVHCNSEGIQSCKTNVRRRDTLRTGARRASSRATSFMSGGCRI